MKTWIQAYPSGLAVYPLELKAEQVRITDVIWALATKNRFTGMTRWPYPVAQHCVLGARLLPWAFKLPFLLHEVSEAYLPDVSSPTKPFLRVQRDGEAGGTITWHELEVHHADVILPAIGLGSLRPLLDAPEVKRMDLAMLHAEHLQLQGPEPEPWGLAEPPADVIIQRWDQRVAANEMLKEFNELTGRAERFELPEEHR